MNPGILPSKVLNITPLKKMGGLPAIVDAATFIANPPEMPGELVEGVLHRGSKMVFGGGSKSYKTWALIDQAVSTATGSDWLGFKTNQSRVLYANFELPAAFMAHRIMEVATAKGVDLPIGNLDIWNLRGCAAALSDLRDKIIAPVRDGGYGLIVIDPIYKLLGDIEENSNTQVTQLLNEIEQIAVQTGAAVVFGHHFSKGGQAGKASIDRVSGAGAWARDPDTIITLTPHEEDKCFTVDLTLRNHPPQREFVVRHTHPLMIRDHSLDPKALRKTGRDPKFSIGQIVALIPDEGILHSELKNAAMDNLNGPGMSEGTFNSYLKKALNDGSIAKNGKRYGIPPYCGT